MCSVWETSEIAWKSSWDVINGFLFLISVSPSTALFIYSELRVTPSSRWICHHSSLQCDWEGSIMSCSVLSQRWTALVPYAELCTRLWVLRPGAKGVLMWLEATTHKSSLFFPNTIHSIYNKYVCVWWFRARLWVKALIHETKFQEPCTSFILLLCWAIDVGIIRCIYVDIFIGCPTFAPLLRVIETKLQPLIRARTDAAATSTPTEGSEMRRWRWGFIGVNHVSDLCVNSGLLMFPILQRFLKGRISKQLSLHFKGWECRPALHNQVANSFLPERQELICATARCNH